MYRLTSASQARAEEEMVEQNLLDGDRVFFPGILDCIKIQCFNRISSLIIRGIEAVLKIVKTAIAVEKEAFHSLHCFGFYF